ncbi:MAG: hypothetical protein K0M45_02135 [Candidatus Paracaedibacteraceae bacterium]|nr:hypothetical protein [Candidatus Paracaedibacteraceae bacterium]
MDKSLSYLPALRLDVPEYTRLSPCRSVPLIGCQLEKMNKAANFVMVSTGIKVFGENEGFDTLIISITPQRMKLL